MGGIRIIKCILVVFGGTGDLAHRKIYPAVFNLFVSGQLPEHFALLSVGRREKSNDAFREEAAESIHRFGKPNKGQDAKLDELLKRFYYTQVDFTESSDYEGLKQTLMELDDRYQTQGGRVFYLAVAPEHFEPIVKNIANAGMSVNKEGNRVVIEKPFGRDLATARQLNEAITKVFDEEQIYRIDHFLGKEMLQNIMVIRFANALFEPLWNNKYIDHIQITSSETVGVENRGGYYENAGAIRDMMQNHMLQLLMLTAMEAPISLDTQSIRDEKVKVLRTLSMMDPARIKRDVVRGQYGPGRAEQKNLLGYREEERVSHYSFTETYMAMRLEIENFRWAGVPFYIRTGKRMPVKQTKIVIRFLELPSILYYKEYKGLDPNYLIIEIQPREGIVLRFNGKKPGTRNEIIPVELDFCQNCAVGAVSPDAYERLLMDVIRGDSTLFTRWDEVEYAWRFIDNISGAWTNEFPEFPNYASGTWGPGKADELLRRDGRHWINE